MEVWCCGVVDVSMVVSVVCVENQCVPSSHVPIFHSAPEVSKQSQKTKEGKKEGATYSMYVRT